MPFESSHRPLARNGLILAGLSALLVLAGCSNDDQPAQQGGGGMPPAAVVVETAELTDASVRQAVPVVPGKWKCAPGSAVFWSSAFTTKGRW